ncbi:hypothetical protein MHC_01430 [Mycoplasma haemocanis str. Illinois]|uniref:Lipoprotein n=1 Tax=Mycoplasma haemocanis (strain Illinois) TaxID=1111676 RepID=H6N680_MYCHN|nr:hypothetical protein [Mycoplasma haemocanis]AEW45152.1 hypothetical protein MHC_01430 [Mycoplasma haemocanis str. Illinois]
MNFTLLKIACGVGAMGVVGTGCYFVSTNLETSKKKTIANRLSKEKFILLNFETGNLEEWKSVLKEYEKVGNVDKFDGISLDTTSSDKDGKNIASLKAACKDLVVKEDLSEDLYRKARRWCVIPQSIKDRMEALGDKILDYTSEKSSNASWAAWEEKIKTYTGKEIISTGSAWSSPSSNDAKVDAIKKDCKSFLEGASRTYDSDFEEKYKKAITWCGLLS